MAVASTQAAGLVSLNRRQPLDPAFIADWLVTLTGDGSGGNSTITATFPVDFAFVPVFVRLDDAGPATDAIFAMNTGATPGPSAGGHALGFHQTVVAVSGISRFSWEPPASMYVPDLGAAGSSISIVPNPGLATDTTQFGRVFLWPRSEVVSVPMAAFWPYIR